MPDTSYHTKLYKVDLLSLITPTVGFIITTCCDNE